MERTRKLHKRRLLIVLIGLAVVLSILTLKRMGSSPSSLDAVELRKFPYPYKAALTICSDLDYTFTMERYLEMQRCFGSFGLEMGDTFWMYTNTPGHISYFEGVTLEKSKDAEQIRKLVLAGYLDCLHTYGNFQRTGGFLSEQAVAAIEELDRAGMKVDVWVNHGDEYNTQNLNKGVASMRGASPGAPEYHIDQTVKYGIKFVWNTEVTEVIGQDRPIRLDEEGPVGWRDPLATVVTVAKAHLGKRTIGARTRENRLLRPLALDDGTKVYVFRRYGSWAHGGVAATRDLIEHLSAETLDTLVANEGYMIIYSHLGNGYPWDTEVTSAFERVGRRQSEGHIYVSTTSKLLNYNLAHNGLVWESDTSPDGSVNIRIAKVRDEVFGDFVPSEADLQGITFYTPNPDATRIYIQEEEVETVERNPKDSLGRLSVSIPLRRLPPLSDVLEERTARGAQA
jgi:hypothetical protein